jgi:hypothetical protein
VTIALYMDHQVPRAITVGLRLRGIDVLTAYEDGASELGDAALLDRASELGRLLFTRDDDLLVEAAKRQKEDIPFGGVVYAHQLRAPIGVCIEDLEIVAMAGEKQDVMNAVVFLPLSK